MRKLLILGISIITAITMTLCSYTPLVTQYINNGENYIDIMVKVSSAEYHETGYSYLYINLLEFSRYKGFTGTMPSDHEQTTLDSTIIAIKIVPENAKLLKDRGFFENVKAGDVVSIITTCWIHDGITRHYLAGITLGASDYLTFDEGMDGISVDTHKFKDIELGEIFKKTR